MAYIEYYKIRFHNDLNQDVHIQIFKEDGVPGTTIQEFAAENVLLTRSSGTPSIFSSIWATVLEITFNVDLLDTDPWNEFINAGSRTFFVTARVEGSYFFHGYLLPDEGAVPLEDKPIGLTITATDGVALLKNIPLTDYNGAEFVGLNHWIDYLAGILKKLELDLPIRIIDNIYHDSMFTRDSNIDLDMWGQAKLEARTFDKDAIEKVDCYTALEILLKKTHRFSYENGEFVVKRLAMFQYEPGGHYYTIYEPDGSNPQGYLDTENHGEVGKNELIYPINANQTKTAKPAVKSVRTNFLWKVWDEVPRNNTFSRGSQISSFGNFREYELDSWEHGRAPATLTGTGSPALIASSKVHLRTEEVNAYGVVIDNFIKMETDGFNRIWLRSEGFPANKGDKISLSVDFRSELDFTVGGGGGLYEFGSIYLIETDGTRWGLNSNGHWIEGTLGAVEYDPGDDQDTREWFNFSVDSGPLPADGTLYIALNAIGSAGGSNVGAEVYWKGFQFTYRMYVFGGFLPVKGDYVSRLQAGYSDKIDDEIFVSDAMKGLIKGAIYADANYLTTPEWSILGAGGQYHYKELTNLSEFNFTRKRYWHIEGDFTSTFWAPENNQTNQRPLSIFRNYVFADLPLLAGMERQFIFVPPLEINLYTGNFIGRFQEVKNAGDDGQAVGDSSEIKYIFANGSN